MKRSDLLNYAQKVLSQRSLQEAQHQWDTPEFKRWFAGSKAVDKWGRPRVFYHGTEADFDVFSHDHDTKGSPGISIGFYVTPSLEMADIYAKSQGSMMPVYVRALNPLHLPGIMEIEEWTPILGQSINYQDYMGDDEEETELEQLYGDLPGRARTYNYLKDFEERWGIARVGSIIVPMIRAKGYDAVVFSEKYTYGGAQAEVWCVFEPNQLKSASGNSGTYNPEDPRITG